MVCALAVGCFSLSAEAVECQSGEVIPFEDLEHERMGVDALGGYAALRAFGKIDITVSPNAIAGANEGFYLEAKETVTINCAYSPTSASLDFGLIDSDSYFHYVSVTGGSINKTIQVNNRGEYILAVRNNSSNAVNVVGFVNY